MANKNAWSSTEETEFIKYLLDNPREYFCDDVAHEFLDTYFEEQNEECAFDEYRCKGCSNYLDCQRNEDYAEAEWELQQQYMNSGLKCINAFTASEPEVISDGDVPF